ncbi:hypothetical protein [Actinoplanes sichuanensis]|uniref:hypothetical protein n=1 Tax=Actinoplanes sichuanensis TaxID=512349 RepID=UPI00366D68A7
MSAPSGAVVLACAGFLDEWAELGEPLSVRAGRAVAAGGCCLRDRLAEAVAVPAGPGSLTATAITRAGAYQPYDTSETIAVLTVDLDLPWAALASGSGPVSLGDLPVDRCGMVVGDARALDSWVGFLHGSRTVDGLADVRVSGRGEEQAWAHFGALPLPSGDGCRGWLDLPVEMARERARAINEWSAEQGLYRHMARVDLHHHQHLGWRAGGPDPLGAGLIEVAGSPVLCLAWTPLELQRFGGGRSAGQVYPVSLENDEGGAVLRWRVPPMGQ